MKQRIFKLLQLIRSGNSINAERSTWIRNELQEIHNHLDMYEEISIFETLKLIIENQKLIMDQNAEINAALDKLSADVSAELQVIAGLIKPGLTDDQANAIIGRINNLDTQITTALSPTPTLDA